MMSMFKKYLLDNEARDFINAVNLYHEIDVYHKTESKPKTKKDLQVNLRAGYCKLKLPAVVGLVHR